MRNIVTSMFGTRGRGETQRMSEREATPNPPRQSIVETAGQRGTDDRRTAVRPGDDPAPVSPQPDDEAVRKGEDILERIKAY